MDASIMDGSDLNAGAICCITDFKNPIKVARKVMDNSEHVILTGDGAKIFGDLMKCEKRDKSYFFDKFRHQQWLDIKDSDKFQLDHSSVKPKKIWNSGCCCFRLKRIIGGSYVYGRNDK
jgi:beta-aspartyl-peptidase (threonine type)